MRFSNYPLNSEEKTFYIIHTFTITLYTYYQVTIQTTVKEKCSFSFVINVIVVF